MRVNLSIFSSKKSAPFLIKSVAFLLLLILADWGIGSAIGFLYRKAPYGANWTKENWLLNKKYDVVILGSSRALRHYVPGVIAEETGLSVFNAGQNGQYMLYSYGLEQLLLSHYAPKLIVLDVLPSFIIKTDNPNEEFERLSTLSPFIENDSVRGLLTRGNVFENLKYASHMYRYNSKILSILENFRSPVDNVDNGYEVMGDMKYHDRNPFIVDRLNTVEIDSFKLEILQKFITSAHAQNVNVIASFSPVCEPVSKRAADILQFYSSLFSELNTPFLNFTTTDYDHYMNLELFIDNIHMDGIGAEQFSTEFGKRLSTMRNDNLLDLAHCE
jgi:hypothetical protein